MPKDCAYSSLYRSGPVPASLASNAVIFQFSSASHARQRPSMFDQSPTSSSLPGSAMMVPRSASEHAWLTSSTFWGSEPSRIAGMISLITSSASRFGRGILCGWKPRPAHRPVRPAPENCSVFRIRPSGPTFSSALSYLAKLLNDESRRSSSSRRVSSSMSSSSSTFFIVSFCRLSIRKPYSPTM